MTIIKFPCLFLLTIILCKNVVSQEVYTKQQKFFLITPQLRQASSYLYGTMGNAYDPARAFELYKELADNGHPQASNAVGVLYAKGLGTTLDNTKALYYYEKAGSLGYKAGLTNAAKMYDNGLGTDQSFVMAYELYKKAAESNDREGKYFYAYYLFKGLGGHQNYTEAYRIFSDLAEKSHASAMYFKALCLRNGYGVYRDLEAAKDWLLKAVALKDKQASEELNINTPENPVVTLKLPFKNKVWDFYNQANHTFKRIKHNANYDDLPGNYQGYIVRYDWSGKYIIEYWPIMLSLEGNGEMLTGNYKDSNDEITINAKLTKQGLQFTNTSFLKSDHYTPEKAKKEFKDAQVEVINMVDSIYLIGNLNLFVPFRNEPEKPTVIYLHKYNTKNQPILNKLLVDIFPNPSSQSINVQFTLPRISSVNLIITDMLGNTIHTEKGGALVAGGYQKNINIEKLPPGIYLIKVVTDHSSYSEKFIKQ